MTSDLYPRLAVPLPDGASSLSAAAVLEAGRLLAARRRDGLQGGVLHPDCRPVHHADALRVQAEVARGLGWPVAGWKCGLPAPGKLVVAPLYGPTVARVEPGVEPVAAAWPWREVEPAQAHGIRVEPELAFVITRDLPPRATPWTTDEVDSAIGATHLALELIDSRYAPEAVPSFDDKLADGLVNQGLFLGPEVDGVAARVAQGFPITLRVPGLPDSVLRGAMPDGAPRGPLYWLAEFLRQQGTGLRAGHVVITGSYAGAFNLPIDVPVELRYGALGVLSVRLQARSSPMP